jgi:DNA-binding beta-propeller fold protein YncE
MSKLTVALFVCAVGCGLTAGLAEDAAFSKKPTVTRDGAQARISFAVSAPTDVEVAVLDKDGQVIRHLAAGLLGKDAPAPFQKNALTQELLWDGKDDAGRAIDFSTGKSANGGPFAVRVQLGLNPALDGILGWDGQTIGGPIVGLAVDLKGELYVLDSDARMKVFSREGKYLRTIMPYPAGLPKERAHSVGQLDVDGERLPIVYSIHPTGPTDGVTTVYPMTSGLIKQNMAFTARGSLILVSAMGTYIEHGPMRHLLALAPEGGAPEGMPFVGPRIRDAIGYIGGSGERGTPWFDHLATSPDNEWIYFIQATDGSRFKRAHGVYRVKWSDPKLGELFVGRPEAGQDDAHFDDPQGIATDKSGNLYVCDRGNNRVVVFSPDGRRLGQFAAEKPEQIAVLPASGEVYILSRPKQAKMLPDATTTIRKFSAWGKGDVRELVVLPFKNVELLSVDPTSNPPQLWVATQAGWNRPMDVIPLVDRGGTFDVGARINNLNGLECPANLAADPDRSRVIIRERDHNLRRRSVVTVDLASGKKTPFMKGGKGPGGLPGVVFALDKAGYIYTGSDFADRSLFRFGPDGSPAPFSGIGTNRVDWEPVEGGNPSRGITVAPNGDIYILRNTRRHEANQVDIYGPDGKLKKADVINGVDRGSCGLGVDLAGNIYLGVNMKPKDHPYPDGFAGLVPAKMWWFWVSGRDFGERPAPWSYTYYNPYLYHWGSMLKFGPAGGAFYGLRPPFKKGDDPYTFVTNAPAGAVSYQTALLEQEVKVKGLLWLRQGYGVVASQVCRWGDPGCSCATSDFAVDLYGRVFSPNPFRFAVEVLDTDGNPLVRIGGYGNADSRGAQSPVPKPEIAFARPSFVSLAKDKLYVSDTVNQRVLVIRLDHAASAECAVP